MTIFLEIAKLILEADITSLKNTSIAEDNGWSNTVMTGVGAGRDPDLSNKKRQLLDKLVTQVKRLNSDKEDRVTLLQLEQLLIKTRSEGEKMSSVKGYDEGKFGPGLGEMSSSLQTFYSFIEKRGLLNIPRDENPLNILRYYVGLYSSHEGTDNFNPGFFKRLLKNPILSKSRPLTVEKTNVFFTLLEECERDLKRLDRQHPDYKEAAEKLVLKTIAELNRRNDQLCSEHKSLLFKPSAGYFRECLDRAEAEITGIKPEALVEAEANAAEHEWAKVQEAQAAVEVLSVEAAAEARASVEAEIASEAKAASADKPVEAAKAMQVVKADKANPTLSKADKKKAKHAAAPKPKVDAIEPRDDEADLESLASKSFV